MRDQDSLRLHDPSRDPAPEPCRDCRRQHLRGEHVVMHGADGRTLWEGCADCWVRRTSPGSVDGALDVLRAAGWEVREDTAWGSLSGPLLVHGASTVDDDGTLVPPREFRRGLAQQPWQPA